MPCKVNAKLLNENLEVIDNVKVRFEPKTQSVSFFDEELANSMFKIESTNIVFMNKNTNVDISTYIYINKLLYKIIKLNIYDTYLECLVYQCNNIPVNIIEYLNTQFIDKSDMDIIDKLLCILNDTNDVPRCPICGKPCKRDGYKYHKSCGNSKCIYGLKKQSMIKKYGVANPFQLESVKEKIKKTNIERYGVDNPAKS